MGLTTRYEYDALNRLTTTINALGGETTFTYDANGNLLTLTDARNNTTTYTYNSMDRVATRTDPLTREETYTYDNNGNLSQVTDRKSQVTAYTYDPLDRQTGLTYHDSSTTSYTYDAGDRATQIVDSIAGTIDREYDLLDRLTEEATPEGTVNYTYDAADRRATMTVAGQTQISYGYDNAHRLTSITQGSALVGFTYDDANRRTVLTLANGVTVETTYNDASEITVLTYKLGANTLGELTYTYDLAGNRSAVGGSWARTNLPPALASATYNDANQISTWGGTSFTYDANGNLTSDGLTSYTWNARNQLVGLSGGTSASFAYDGSGRRRGKTIAGTTTKFLYDGMNFVQELTSGGTSVANLLTGLDVDEVFRRTDSAGARDFLTDALGSSLELADASGALQTHYTFDPFGATTVSGATSTNAAQFTGRENDGTGLYFNRARFYNPSLQRWMSEDPIEFVSGEVNLYAYVGNEPTMWRDPSGLIIYRPLPGSPCYIPPSGRKDEPQKPPLSWYLTCSPFVVPDLWPIPIPLRLPGVPRPPRNFEPPTNPPQMPPKTIPPGWRVRPGPPKEGYPDGYWRLEKPMRDRGWQGINPKTMKPGPHPDTHVPYPPGMGPK